ncbi:MAG: NAD-dependent epimerase/dehydratase family protein [Pseudomonadota bacterium]
MHNTILILGANGRLGAVAAIAFADAGWNVFAQVRRGSAFRHARITPVRIPLEHTDALAKSCGDTRAVLHAVNVPYTRWGAEMLPLGRLGMDVAQRLGATFMLPGNVYGYGASMPSRLTPETPERPTAEKGRIRVALESEMHHRAVSGLESVVIRAGDFFGCGPGSWFDRVILRSVVAGKLVYPGPLDVAHAWAYVPDLARAFVAVAQGPRLRGFSALGFPGHNATGGQLLSALEIAALQVGFRPRRGRFRWGSFPWPIVRLGALVVPTFRELAEVSYLWERPHALDGMALERRVGTLPQTPLIEALAAALQSFLENSKRVA